jgi:DnaK suppressor protein
MREDINLNYFKKLLEERLEAITARREAQKEDEAPVELDQARVGRLTRMDAMQQQAMAQASGRRIELERQRIVSALNRIETGDYGYCLKCEDEIFEGRLRFDPSVLVCISCAKDAEGK